jgi:predicted PurR-regulated permease PerM
VSYRPSTTTSATDRLQQAAQGAELEKNSDVLKQVHLRRRVKNLVDDIPNWLAGGRAQGDRSAATSGVAFVAGLILTIFFLSTGRAFEAGLLQIRQKQRAGRARGVAGTRRGLDYARSLFVALVWVRACVIAPRTSRPCCARRVGRDGRSSRSPASSSALSIVLFAGASSLTRAVVVTLFVAIGIAEYVLNGYVERETVDVGSFLVVLGAFGGLELYGLTGALLGVLGIVIVVALLDEYDRETETDPTVEVVTPRRE